MKFKALQLAAVSAAAIATVSTAQAGVYGRITHSVVTGDTASDEIEIQRLGWAESTLGAKGSIKAGGLTYGAKVELGIGDGIGGGQRNRIAAFSIAGDFGKVSVGDNYAPGFVLAEVDSSGTWIADPSGSLFDAGAGGGAGYDSANITSPFFGGVLRYDSPKLGGIATVSGAIFDGTGGNEVTLKIDTNGVKFRAWASSEEIGDRTGFLLGYKHSSGLSATVVSGENGLDEELTSFKIGYQTGKHAVSVQVNETENLVQVDPVTSVVTILPEDEGTSVAYVFSAAKGVKLWARNVSGDVSGDSVTAFGGMVKF